MFRSWFGKKTRRARAQKRVVILLDWENLLSTTTTYPPERFSLEGELNRTIERIAQEVGVIIGIYVFIPPHLAPAWGETFKKQGFFTIFCPKRKDKEGQEADGVDEELIRFGTKMIEQVSDLTHFCLGSGDQDFVPLLREARLHSLEVIVVAGNLQSLSSELLPFAEKKPRSGKRRVYLLSEDE